MTFFTDHLQRAPKVPKEAFFDAMLAVECSAVRSSEKLSGVGAASRQFFFCFGIRISARSNGGGAVEPHRGVGAFSSTGGARGGRFLPHRGGGAQGGGLKTKNIPAPQKKNLTPFSLN